VAGGGDEALERTVCGPARLSGAPASHAGFLEPGQYPEPPAVDAGELVSIRVGRGKPSNGNYQYTGVERMNKTVWVGIDVGKYTFQSAVADGSALPRQWASLPVAQFEHSGQGMSQFLRWLENSGWAREDIAGVCIEATGRYTYQWVQLLQERLGPVCVVNPALPKAYAHTLGIRDKSDRVDACVIALYAQAIQPQASPSDSATQRELRELSRLHQSLEEQCQANQQRLADGPSCALARAILKKTITALRRQIQNVKRALDRLIRNDDALSKDFDRARTVTGIGPKTATLILAEFGDLRRYNRDELVALSGLYPREFTSGVSVHRRPQLAKAGKASVRAALYMCAMSAVQANPHLRQFARRLKSNQKAPMQILGAVMRKLLLLVRAVIVTETDYDPQYAHTLQSQAT
jgi:transposase